MNHYNDSVTKELNQWALDVFGLPVALAAILAGLDWLAWDWVSFGLGMLIFMLTCAWLIALQWVSKRGPDVETALLSGGLSLIFVFPYLCKAVFELWGSNAFLGDAPLTLSDYVWFTAENIGGVLLLDAFDVYEIKLSRIEYVATFWPSTLIFLFRTAVGFGVVSAVVHSYGSVFRRIAQRSAEKKV
jgi:hypothetical protein